MKAKEKKSHSPMFWKLICWKSINHEKKNEGYKNLSIDEFEIWNCQTRK